MFLLLIIAISLLIRVLRLLISKTEVAVYSETKNYIKKGAYYSSNAVLHTVVNALRALRVMLLSVGSVIIVFEIICALLLMLNAAGAFLLYYSDETSSDSNYTTVVSSSTSDYAGSLDFSDIDSDDARNLLQELSKSWTADVTEDRKNVIFKGATRVGHSTYRMDSSRGGASDDTELFDCSSFVGWCFYMTGHKDVSASSVTSDYVDGSMGFKEVSVNELIPGDVGLKNKSTVNGGSNHIGIYVGDIDGVKYFMHCSSSKGTVVIVPYSSFTVFFRYGGWGS